MTSKMAQEISDKIVSYKFTFFMNMNIILSINFILCLL